jgi:hypothetical protein
LYRSPPSNVDSSRPKNRQDTGFSTFGTKKFYEFLTPALKDKEFRTLSASGYAGVGTAVANMIKPEVVAAINKINEYAGKTCGIASNLIF